MDIAEIRKKAKARADQTPQEPAQEPAPAAEPAAGPEPPDANEEETAAYVPDDPTVASLDEEGAADQAAAENELDRLFAETDDWALATEESYAEMLEVAADAQNGETTQYLAFHLADEEYALDIRQISEIIKVRELTDIPRAPAYILGIISLRGVVVPVFDLRQRLNLGKTEITSSSRIVVCQAEEMVVGLLVDSINQVVNLVDDEVEPPPGVLSGLDREMVFGIGRWEGRMMILLQLDSVLDVALQ